MDRNGQTLAQTCCSRDRVAGDPEWGTVYDTGAVKAGKQNKGCVYVVLSLQMFIGVCTAWSAWNGLLLCLHDCSHLAFSYKAYKSLFSVGSLPSWLHSLIWDLWDLTSAEVPSDSEVRGRRRKRKRSVAHTFLRCIAEWTHSVRLHKRGLDCISFAVIVFAEKAYGRAYRQFTVV